MTFNARAFQFIMEVVRSWALLVNGQHALCDAAYCELGRTFHVPVTIAQAVHTCDFYITKIHGKGNGAAAGHAYQYSP